jgi:hypothetical protein
MLFYWRNSFQLGIRLANSGWLNTHSLRSGGTVCCTSDEKMLRANAETAVMVCKLMPNSNKAQLLTYAVHKKEVSFLGRGKFCIYFGLRHTYCFKSFSSHSLVMHDDAALRNINFISEKNQSANYKVSQLDQRAKCMSEADSQALLRNAWTLKIAYGRLGCDVV